MIGTGVEVMVAALFVWFMATQVALPIWRDTKFCPFFRREHKLEDQRREVAQALREKELEEEVESLRVRLAEKKQATDAADDIRAMRLANDNAGEERE